MGVPEKPRTVAGPEEHERARLLLEGGMPLRQIANEIGRDIKTIRDWLEKDLSMQKALRAGSKLRALEEVPKNIERLVEIRDKSKNDMAVLKAIDALDIRAGLPIRGEDHSRNIINILGENVQITEIRGADVDTLIKKIAARMGPNAEKVVEAEIAGRPGEPEPENRDGDAGAADTTPGGAPRDEGEAP